MRVLLALAVSIALAGCTFAEESSEPPEDAATPAPPTPSDAAPDATSSTPAAPPPATPTPSPAPPPSPPVATTPPALPPPTSPAPTPSPTPPPPSPAPAPTPSPTPAPTSAPAPTPTPAPAWPREGSFVTFQSNVTQSFSGTTQGWKTWANATWRYSAGDWTGTCVQHTVGIDGAGTAYDRTETRSYTIRDPPHWPILNTRSPPGIGEDVRTWTLRGCTIENDTWPYRGVVDGYHVASSNPNEPPYDFRTEWSTKSGLVVEWSLQRYMTQAPFSSVGRLVATDAPLT